MVYPFKVNRLGFAATQRSRNRGKSKVAVAPVFQLKEQDINPKKHTCAAT